MTHNEHLLEAELLPSGEVVLRCAQTGLPVGHLGDLHVDRLVHAPRGESFVVLKASLKVPLRCDSGDAMELVGGFVRAGECTCPVHQAQEEDSE